MSEPSTSTDVVIVGGGIIGLAIAWRARERGLAVTLLERDTIGQGTSRVAAGMLAPVAEVEFGRDGRRLLEMGLRSARMWPEFAAELERASEQEVGLRRTGTLVLARDDDEARELERQLDYRLQLGLRARRLRPSVAREHEPAIAPTVRLAIEAPDDHSVDPRRVLAALRRACELAGVVIREGAEVESIALDGSGERVEGVMLAGGRGPAQRGPAQRGPAQRGPVQRGPAQRGSGGSGSARRLPAREVVIAAGPWSARIGGVPPGARVDVRPVKGQILRLRDPAGPGLLTRVVRWQGGYVVPRGDGRYVLGASVEERGFDLEPTAGAVYELLRDCGELVPGVDELRIEELSVGLRPGTPDNTPILGRATVDGLVWATGHYRNGILLAPLTAEIVVEELTGVLV